MPNDLWHNHRVEGAAVRTRAAALHERCAELRQRGLFARRRLARLLIRSADLATIVRFQERMPLERAPASVPLRLLL